MDHNKKSICLLSYNISWGQYGCMVSWDVLQVCLCVDFVSILVPCGQYGGMVGWLSWMCFKCVDYFMVCFNIMWSVWWYGWLIVLDVFQVC